MDHVDCDSDDLNGNDYSSVLASGDFIQSFNRSNQTAKGDEEDDDFDEPSVYDVDEYED